MKTAISGKTIVITGASAGLGRAIAREFARYDNRIGLIARGYDGLEKAKAEVEDRGSRAITLEVDVSDASKLEEAAQQVEEQFGAIDIWINNAMVSVFGELKNMSPEEFKRVTEVTYLGQVYGTMVALKRMHPCNKGTIILIGSALAYRGIPLQSAYCGAKHGIHGFFESLRSELIHEQSKIKLSMIQMPAMNTTQFGFVRNKLPYKPRPMGTIYDPEIAAKAVSHVVQHPKREMNVGFSTIEAILGNKLCPDYMDQYMAHTGYEGQQTSELADPDAKDNLWEPLPGDHGVYGSFEKEMTQGIPSLWTARHKWITLAGALMVSGTLSWTIFKLWNNRKS